MVRYGRYANLWCVYGSTSWLGHSFSAFGTRTSADFSCQEVVSMKVTLSRRLRTHLHAKCEVRRFCSPLPAARDASHHSPCSVWHPSCPGPRPWTCCPRVGNARKSFWMVSIALTSSSGIKAVRPCTIMGSSAVCLAMSAANIIRCATTRRHLRHHRSNHHRHRRCLRHRHHRRHRPLELQLPAS